MKNGILVFSLLRKVCSVKQNLRLKTNTHSHTHILSLSLSLSADINKNISPSKNVNCTQPWVDSSETLTGGTTCCTGEMQLFSHFKFAPDLTTKAIGWQGAQSTSVIYSIRELELV